jgi:hypothetical protein
MSGGGITWAKVKQGAKASTKGAAFVNTHKKTAEKTAVF